MSHFMRAINTHSTVCAVYANFLLPHAQNALTKHNISGTSNKANHTQILPLQLNQVKTYEKVKNRKGYFDTFKWASKESEKTFLCANSKSKIVVGVHCAYASKDKTITLAQM